MNAFGLVVPSLQYLSSYETALRRGWSPDNLRPERAAEELVEIDRDARSFVAIKADDRQAKGGPLKLPDGTFAPRLPGFVRWMCDGEICGAIGARWQPGTGALPAHVLGHVGYSVVPWKQRRGYATTALALMLQELRLEGLPYVEITTDISNIPSQKVILANGGQLVERFRAPPQYDSAEERLRYRIGLSL